MSEIFDVAVIGGGLHGLSAALQLARSSLRVVVLERSWSGRHSSGATAAGVRSLGRDPAELEISLEALHMWHHIESLVGDSCGFSAHGQIRIAEDEKAFEAIEKNVSTLRAKGYKHVSMIDRAEVLRRIPALGGKCLGAEIAPDDGAADPHRTLAAFRRSALSAGVVIREGCGLKGIDRKGESWSIETTQDQIVVAPMIVNAAGAWGNQVAAMVGDDIPMGLKASMMMVTERLQPFLRPVVASYGRQLSFKQAEQGGLVIGGGIQGAADLAAETSHVRFAKLAKGALDAVTLFPCVKGVRIVRTWAGLEATPRDHLPIVCASVNGPGVFHAFGFSGHGFALVPVVGAIIADLVTKGETGRQISGLHVGRLMNAPAVA
jgi:sarcosine oxidase, subunit beta